MITLYLVIPCYNEELVIADSAEKLMCFMNKQIEVGGYRQTVGYVS